MWVPKPVVSCELFCSHYKVTLSKENFLKIKEISSSSATKEEEKKSCTVSIHELMQTSVKRNQQHQGKMMF